MSKDIYVLVCDRDIPVDCHPSHRPRPLVLESYIDGDNASLDSIKAFRERLEGRYGKARIARLEFIDDGETDKPASQP